MTLRTFLLLACLQLLALSSQACQPAKEILAGEFSNVKSVTSEDAEMNEAIHNAQASLDHFIEALQSPSPTQTVFQIKVRFPYDGEGYAEHMWLGNVTFDGNFFVGTLGNEPVFIQEVLHYGD